MLRDMADMAKFNENLYRMFPLQNALTTYEMTLETLMDVLTVRASLSLCLSLPDPPRAQQCMCNDTGQCAVCCVLCAVCCVYCLQCAV